MSTIKKGLLGLLSLVVTLSLLTVPAFAATPADGEYTVNITAINPDTGDVHLRNSDLVNPAKLVVKDGVITATLESVGRELTFLNPSTGEYENHTVGGDSGSDGGDYTSDYEQNATAQRIYQLTLSSLDNLTVKFPAGGSATGALTYYIAFDESSLTKVGGDDTAAEDTTSTDTTEDEDTTSTDTTEDEDTTSTDTTEDEDTTSTDDSTTDDSTTDTTTTTTTTTSTTDSKVVTPKTGDSIQSTLAIILVAFVSISAITVIVNRKALFSKKLNKN